MAEMIKFVKVRSLSSTSEDHSTHSYRYVIVAAADFFHEITIYFDNFLLDMLVG